MMKKSKNRRGKAMPSFWENVKGTLKQKATHLGEKVGEYGKYSKLTIHKYNLTQEVGEIASDLGGRVYTLFSGKMLDRVIDDEEALDLMLKIRGIEQEIQEVDEKLNKLKSEQKKEKKRK
jgi:hypothetical protein